MMAASDLFGFPWPGPGNSEGPGNPGDWAEVEASGTPLERGADSEMSLLNTSPWPGPGDSEGTVSERLPID
jgi:hypothetical protein